MKSKDTILYALTDKNDSTAYALTEKIIAESHNTDEWYAYFEEFYRLLAHKKSFVRNRGLMLLAANMQWDEENRFASMIDGFLSHIADEKPVTARQCIKSAAEIGVAKPQYISRILTALQSADLSQYKDSMCPLLKKDISLAVKTLTSLEEIS